MLAVEVEPVPVAEPEAAVAAFEVAVEARTAAEEVPVVRTEEQRVAAVGTEPEAVEELVAELVAEASEVGQQ